jgi:putative DNA primase/helicase
MTTEQAALADAPAATGPSEPTTAPHAAAANTPSEPAPVDWPAELARLAELNAPAYAQARKAEAERLGVRMADLDRMVNRHRAAAVAGTTEASGLALLQSAIQAREDRLVREYGPGRFEVSEREGVVYIAKDPETGSQRQIWVCSHLQVVAQTRDGNSESWGVLLRWKDPAGLQHELALPAQMLQTDGADMRRMLADLGLKIAVTQTGRQYLQTYLQVWNPGRFAHCVDRMGWQGDLFVMPGVDNDHAEELTVFQNANSAAPAFACAGTVEDWRGTVAAMSVGNPRLMFAVATAFAGALLEPTATDSGGFHFRGGSSSGKSTAQEAAASVWGAPAKYKRSWRATANGLEGVAVMHNDGLLILDELSQCPAREVGEAVYMLANGQGKGRATRTGAAKAAQSWRLVVLSSGEESLAALMAQGGKQIKAGQEIRLAEIEADAGAGLGMFESIHGHANSAKFSDAVKKAAAEHYGAPGIAWVRFVMQTRADLPQRARRLIEAFMAAHVPGEASGQVQRVARRFGLVAAAGELATEAGITGWPKGEATQAVARCFGAWLAGFGGVGNQEDRALKRQVREFFEAHGASRFDDLRATTDRTIINRAGFFRDAPEGGGREYLVLPGAFRQDICAGFDAKHAAKVLLATGWLRPDRDGKSTRPERLPGMERTRCYVFTPAMWAEDAP